MNLTDHFTLDEFIASATAERLGISNKPDVEAMRRLYEVASMLEKIRALCNHRPVLITSGYRSPELNKAIGGAAKSAHMEGRAVDFKIPKFGTPLEIVERILLSQLDFDQIIYEGSWVHLAISDHPRRQALIATFVDGVAKYRDWEWGQG